jgi:16S rRNA (guanine966-N2)-methyltransferase
MTRVVGGSAGGRRLAVPPGRTTRPTSDRAREGLFSTLTALRGPGGLGGARMLDLYAGSGAVGLEALSRGAAEVVLVEKDRRAADVARSNAAALGLPGARVVTDDVARTTRSSHAGAPYDLVFLDPPYGEPADRLAGVLAELAGNGWLAPWALVVLERSSHDPQWRWPAGFDEVQVRRYGEATLWYGRAAGPGTAPAGQATAE